MEMHTWLNTNILWYDRGYTYPGQCVLHPRTRFWIRATLMLRPAICRRPVVNMNILCQGKRILCLNKYILLQEHFVDSVAETYNTDDDTLIHCAYLKMPEELKLLNWEQSQQHNILENARFSIPLFLRTTTHRLTTRRATEHAKTAIGWLIASGHSAKNTATCTSTTK